MKSIVMVLGVATTVLALWGLLAPRGLWYSLFGWSFADPRAGEPGTGSYLVRRLLLGFGLASIATMGVVLAVDNIVNPPRVAPPPTPVEQMWGSGAHQVVNRVVTPVGAAPAGLTEVPVLGYQAITDEDGPGDYLRLLPEFSLLGSTEIPGLVGAPPSDGYGAIDTAELMLHVRGPLLCAPRAVLVVEGAESVTVAVYYGRPDSPDGSLVDNAVLCPAGAPVTASALIPIELAADLEGRTVLTLTGEQLDEVALIEP